MLPSARYGDTLGSPRANARCRDPRTVADPVESARPRNGVHIRDERDIRGVAVRGCGGWRDGGGG